ncbi:choice-of-anchor Q domain-containing protein [Lysobacter korlensis]|uniref:Choice-of-anchor Q domain-containing protein n=1 Tax=Lysobacter korlensis TaxID=553636 RepID=A0ABV6RZI9_9GAMM
MLVLAGANITVTHLTFDDGVVFDNSDGQGIRGPKYELSGAIAVTSNGTNAHISDNVFTDVGVGVKTYGFGSKVLHNTFRDLRIAFRGMDSGSETSYGALGVSANNSNIEIAYNDFINCRSTNSPYGADGGAIEIEGFAHDKDNITIHHNYSRGSQGFVEVTETTSSGVVIRNNVSDDYQQFVAWDTTTHPTGYLAVNNTVVRRHSSGLSRLFDIYYYREPGPAPSADWITIRNNIFYTPNRSTLGVFDFPHDHNLFYGGTNPVGFPLGSGDLISDPRFVNFASGDLRLSVASPAVDNGAAAGSSTDLDGNATGIGAGSDIGAFERQAAPTFGANAVADGGFESQLTVTASSSPWNSQGSLSYGVDVNAGKARSGQDNGWIATSGSSSWGALRQTVAVTPNTNYRMTAWVRNSGNFDQAWIGAKTIGGAVLNEVRHGKAPQYNRFTVTFNSGSNSSVVLHVGFWGVNSTAWEQIDDVALQAF